VADADRADGPRSAVSLTLGTLAAYTSARERFRGSALAYTFILASRLLPPMAVAIPSSMVLRQLGLLDTKLALVLVHSAFTLPFTIWVLTLSFRSLPVELADAALVDGCTRFGALRHVVLPLAAPGWRRSAPSASCSATTSSRSRCSPRRRSSRRRCR
jgi:ABC-type glycerol-3-phosphate transport system permease component